jgi:hypothetical protein
VVADPPTCGDEGIGHHLGKVRERKGRADTFGRADVLTEATHLSEECAVPGHVDTEAETTIQINQSQCTWVQDIRKGISHF